MSLTGGFFNSKDHDRRYNAETISRIFDGIIEDGVYETYGEKLIVNASSGMDISVGSGRAWFAHCWILNDSKYRLTVDTSDVVLNRKDTVVLDVDHSVGVRAVSLKIVRGLPASSPVPATLVSEEDHIQVPLSYIYVGAGVTEITQANITNLVGTSACPFVIGVLKTINAEELLTQWEQDYKEWKAAKEKNYDEWVSEQTTEYTTWTSEMKTSFREWIKDLEGSLDTSGDVATQLMNEISKAKMRYKSFSVDTDEWASTDEVYNGVRYHAKYTIPVIGVTEGATSCWLEIVSGTANYQELLTSNTGSFTIYSESKELESITYRIWFIGTAEGGDPTPTQLDEIVSDIVEINNRLGKGGVTISKADYDKLSEAEQNNGTMYFVYDDDESEQLYDSSIIHLEEDGSKISLASKVNDINGRLSNRVQLSLDAVAVGKDEDGDTIYEKTFKGTTISSGTVLDSNLTVSNLKWFRLVGGCFNTSDAFNVLPYDVFTGGSRYNFMIFSNSKGLVVEYHSVTPKMYHFTVQYVLA